MKRAARVFGTTGALLALLAVAGAAVASHALATRPPEDLARVTLALAFQGAHALALILVALLARDTTSRMLALAGAAFVLGVVLFCGSLYAKALYGASSALAPLGGTLLMIGWAALAAHFVFDGRSRLR